MCDAVVVRRNNEIQLHEIDEFDKIVLSPGPGLPKDAGVMPLLLQEFVGKKPILGVCLGMQAIAEYYGGELYNQSVVKHGITTVIKTSSENLLFHGLPKEITVGLYHSWAVTSLPSSLKVTALSSEEVIMAVEDENLHVYGVQFHPESILTECGKEMLKNFVELG
jgi:anthranilate synthase component 2